MTRKIILLSNALIIILISYSCSYQYNEEKKISETKYEVLPLNVKSIKINKDNLIKKENNQYAEEITSKLLYGLEQWAENKFYVRGKEKLLVLNILEINTKLIEKEQNQKKLLNSFFKARKSIYKVFLKINLNFIQPNKESKILNISSNIDISLLDTNSIRKKNEIITYKISQVINLIDTEINVKLNEKIFKEFVILER